MDYTKGDWQNTGKSAFAYSGLHIETADYAIAIVNDLPGNGNGNVNARLVAAAPELYEALKAISKLDKQIITTGDFIASLMPLMEQADKALAKAEGK